MNLSDEQIFEMMQQTAKAAAAAVAARLGAACDEISQREAYRNFGEAKVKQWMRMELIHPIKLKNGNSKVTYSRTELEIAATTERIACDEFNNKYEQIRENIDLLHLFGLNEKTNTVPVPLILKKLKKDGFDIKPQGRGILITRIQKRRISTH